jgi:hypothetical protein
MWLLFRWHYHQTFPKEKIDALFEPVTSKYGIKIVYEIGDDFFSPLENPPIPAGPPRKSKVKPIRHRVLIKYPDILQKAFRKYPVKVIENYVDAIFFAGEIDDGELKYGGTYDPFRRIIYLVNSGLINDYQALSAIHHEFSSLLLSRHSFFINPWTDHNQPDFVYLREICNNPSQTYNSASLDGSEVDYEKGFMNTYGQTDFENDFNEYSAMIFTYPEKFKMIMNQYPRVRGKFLVWLDFYQMIDPIFTEAYLLGEAENGTKQIPP